MLDNVKDSHCVKSVRIRSYSGPYFLAFGLNTESYFVFRRWFVFHKYSWKKYSYKIINKMVTFKSMAAFVKNVI